MNPFGLLELGRSQVLLKLRKCILNQGNGLKRMLVLKLLLQQGLFMEVPINPYGKAKKMAEDMILDFSRNSNMGVMILRYFNVIGSNLEGRLGEALRPELREHGRISDACFEEGMVQKAVEERMEVVWRENEETIEAIRRENTKNMEALRLESVTNMQATIQAMIDAGKLMVPSTMPRQDTSED